jgi:hypothetical protein
MSEQTKRVNVVALTGGFLDYLVAHALELKPIYIDETDSCWITINSKTGGGKISQYSPTTYWKHGGPIVESEGIDIVQSLTYEDDIHYVASYACHLPAYINSTVTIGSTRLEAAMRCFIKQKHGMDIQITETEYKYYESSKIWANSNRKKPLPTTILMDDTELTEEYEYEEPINKSADPIELVPMGDDTT